MRLSPELIVKLFEELETKFKSNSIYYKIISAIINHFKNNSKPYNVLKDFKTIKAPICGTIYYFFLNDNKFISSFTGEFANKRDKEKILTAWIVSFPGPHVQAHELADGHDTKELKKCIESLNKQIQTLSTKLSNEIIKHEQYTISLGLTIQALLEQKQQIISLQETTFHHATVIIQLMKSNPKHLDPPVPLKLKFDPQCPGKGQ